MNPKFNNMKIKYLLPSEICFSNRETIVSTVLGSCLAVTMFSKEKKFGMVSHCMLPNCKQHKIECSRCRDIYKYVDCTMLNMLSKFKNMNIKSEEIEVKIFGGADVLTTQKWGDRVETVGVQNINMALSLINKFDLNLVSSDVGGSKGRRIFFQTDTGEVFVKK